MSVGNLFSFLEAQSRRGEKSKLLIQWTRFIGCETSVLPISNSIGEVKTSHPLVQSIKSSLVESLSPNGKKFKSLIHWARFIGCETSVLPISKSIGEVKTSHPLVQNSINNYLSRSAPLREN